MPVRRATLGCIALAALACVAASALLAPAYAADTTRAQTRASSVTVTALLRSRLLWATIDVCNPADQPDTVGVRGSMPGDGQVNDRLYMSFQLQSADASTHQWVDLPDAATAFVSVGGARTARQGGQSFTLTPAPGKPAFSLRGVVSFQWRRGKHVIASAWRATSAARASNAGADPAGFSAASCQIS